MESYTILLPNEKVKTYAYVTLFILLINLLAFVYVFFKSNTGHSFYFSLSGAVASLLAVVMHSIRVYRNNSKKFRPFFFLLICCACWLFMGMLVSGIFVGTFAVMSIFATRNFEVIFSEEKIIYPSFPVKEYKWSDLNNVVLKDDILTIDFKNNKLIQSVIAAFQPNSFDEKTFNTFCNTCQNKP